MLCTEFTVVAFGLKAGVSRLFYADIVEGSA